VFKRRVIFAGFFTGFSEVSLWFSIPFGVVSCGDTLLCYFQDPKKELTKIDTEASTTM
jgi:hypothetical protein